LDAPYFSKLLAACDFQGRLDVNLDMIRKEDVRFSGSIVSLRCGQLSEI
jgi:hypothetical protein